MGREEIADLIAAHEEFHLAGQQHQGAVRLGAAWNDLHVEPVFRVCPVDQRLIESACSGSASQLVPNLTLSSASAGSAQAVIVANAATITERGRTAPGRLWANRFTENTSTISPEDQPLSEGKARRVIAKGEWHPGELYRLSTWLTPPGSQTCT